MELLLRMNANIYAVDDRSWNAVHYASYNGHAHVVNKLVKWESDNGVLQDMRSSQNKLPFNYAKDALVKKAFIQIWRCCKYGELDKVRILIREGQDVNEPTTNYRNTALHIAAMFGHVLICKFLLA